MAIVTQAPDQTRSGSPSPIAPIRLLGSGDGWRVRDIVCSAGPTHRAYAERHDFVAIAAVVAGSFAYRSTHGAVLLTPGALLLGNIDGCFECGHEHAVGDRCVAFNYTREAFAEIAAATPGVTRDDFITHRIPAATATAAIVAVAAAAVAPAVTEPGVDWQELAVAVAGRVLALLAGQPRTYRRASRRGERRITDAVRLIEARYAEPLPLADLASSTGMGRYHFLRVFRQTVGLTPHQYVLKTRLRHAAVRLRAGEPSIAALAFDVGFGDLSTFNAAFRQSFGVSPSAYRARSIRRPGGSGG